MLKSYYYLPVQYCLTLCQTVYKFQASSFDKLSFFPQAGVLWLQSSVMKVDFQIPCLQDDGSHKGDATQDDVQQRFLVFLALQHCCNIVLKSYNNHCSNIATLCCAKNHHCESSHVTYHLKIPEVQVRVCHYWQRLFSFT